MTKKTRQHRSRRRRRRRRKENTKERKGAQRKRAEGSAPTDDVSTIYKYIHTYHTHTFGGGFWEIPHLEDWRLEELAKKPIWSFKFETAGVDLQTQNAFFDEQRWSSSPPPPWVCFNRQAAKSKLCCSETMVGTKHFDEAMKKRQNSKCDLQRPTRPLP